jgi:hypothetical protein
MKETQVPISRRTLMEFTWQSLWECFQQWYWHWQKCVTAEGKSRKLDTITGKFIRTKICEIFVCRILHVLYSTQYCCFLHFTLYCLILKLERLQDVAVKFPEWFYCKHTCILTVYWEGSSLKYSPWAARHWALWCCHCWKHFWNSCHGIASSAIITLFWMSSTSWNLHPFNADFIFGNSHKSFRAT